MTPALRHAIFISLLSGSALLLACGGTDTGDSTEGDGDKTSTGGASAGDGDDASGGDGDGDGDDVSTGTGGFMATPTDCQVDGDGTTTIVFVNHCGGELTYAGSDIPGGTLAVDEVTCQDVGTDTEALNAKRYWGYLGEDPGGEKHTLAEFTFNTDFYDFDWYNISHVDAHNLTMRITPLDRENCESLVCAQSLIDDCPEIGQLKNDQGDVISCVSPDRDNSGSPVALHFESCEDGYAWSGDDQHGEDRSPVRSCAGEDWEIVFCP